MLIKELFSLLCSMDSTLTIEKETHCEHFCLRREKWGIKLIGYNNLCAYANLKYYSTFCRLNLGSKLRVLSDFLSL